MSSEDLWVLQEPTNQKRSFIGGKSITHTDTHTDTHTYTHTYIPTYLLLSYAHYIGAVAVGVFTHFSPAAAIVHLTFIRGAWN